MSQNPNLEIQEFKVVRSAGYRTIQLEGVGQGIQFYFTLHQDDDDRSQLVFEVGDQKIPIVLKSEVIVLKKPALQLLH
mgnify:CR=1 FL=1